MVGTETPTAVDLFCGCGGASLGIESAEFDLVASVDNNEDRIETHRKNTTTDVHLVHDLTDVDPSILPEKAQNPDYLHGSPPCKGFSVAGPRDPEDERNQLVFRFVDWVEELNPRAFTMENVSGMRSISENFLETIEGAFREIGYSVAWRELNAADFGVPQTRKRVIAVGVRDDVKTPSQWFPSPTHAKTRTTTLSGETLPEWVSVREALFEEKEETITDGGDVVVTNQFNEPHQFAGRLDFDSLDEPSCTIRGGTPNGLVKKEDAKWLTRRIHEYYQADGDRPLQNMDDPVSTICCDGAPAIVDEDADVSEEGVVEEPMEKSDMIMRRLTVRECARLQSFPDGFEFDDRITYATEEIGNAVPPLLMKHIAMQVQEILSP